jgi:hypothetical protein
MPRVGLVRNVHVLGFVALVGRRIDMVRVSCVVHRLLILRNTFYLNPLCSVLLVGLLLELPCMTVCACRRACVYSSFSNVRRQRNS